MKKFKKFMEENEDQTLWSMAWSLYWRGAVIFLGAYFVIVFVILVFVLALEL